MKLIGRLIAFLLVASSIAYAVPKLDDCEFKCGDGKCISAYWRCDNVPDCADGSDESNCNYLHDCEKGSFMCISGECIPASKKCDGIKDCADGSDERGCPEFDVSTLLSAVEFEELLGHVEVSPSPDVLPKKSVYPSKCPQRDASLFFTDNGGSIFRFRITDSAQQPTLFKENAGDDDLITSLSHNRSSNELLFTTKRSDARIQAINREAQVRNFANHDSEHFSRIAVDPLTHNIYFAEDGYGIGVCDKTAKNCVNLIPASTHEQRFRDLVFHTRRGTMIWIQDEPKPVVKIAGMDGKDPRHLSVFNEVHAIALDNENEMLYVADEDSIVQLNLRTLDHIEFANVRASDLLFYNCEVFYVTRDVPALRVISSQLEDKMIGKLSGTGSVLVAVPDVDKFVQTNPCSNASCEEVCVLAENSIEPEARCLHKLSGSVEIVKEGSSLLSWIVTIILISMFFLLIALFVVVYFRLWPDLCDRLDDFLGFSKTNNLSNVSVGFVNTTEAV